MHKYTGGQISDRRKPVIELENVSVVDPEDGASTSVSVRLERGQSALFKGSSLPILRALMEACLGVRPPEKGTVSWSMGCGGPKSGDLWKGYDFFRRIGYIDRFSQLLSNLTLLENLVLMFSYSRFAQDNALQRAGEVLSYLGLEQWADVPASDLPEPQRRLSLYALAFCKEPFFFLLERPSQFLDKDFKKVWGILSSARQKGVALLVFDRSDIAYQNENFDFILPFEPYI